MKVLVTGGSGFIGSHVVDRLVEAGHEPVIYDLETSPWRADIATELGSLDDLTRLELAMAGCDAVMHLAAAADVGEVAREPVASEAANARGTLHVLEAARNTGVERVVYASTIWVYTGEPGQQVDEESELGMPNHLYTASKLAGEMYCRSYGELYGLQSTILRFGIPYGPRARPAAVLPAFVNRALDGESLTVAGAGDQSRRFVYVEDLADGCVRALAPEAAGRTYNLVGDESVTVLEIAEIVQELVAPVGIEHTEQRAADYVGVEVSGERARRELGWTAKTPFREGVGRYVDWRRETGGSAPSGAPSPAAAATGEPAAGDRLRILMPVLYALASAGILVAYMFAVNATELEPGQSRLVDTTLICALALFLVIEVMWHDPRSRAPATVIASVIAAFFALAVFTPWGHSMLRIDAPDPASVVFAVTGAALAIALAASVIAAARARGLIAQRNESPAES